MAEILEIPPGLLPLQNDTELFWHKNTGDFVNKGDLLLEIKTKINTTKINSPFEGVLLNRAGLPFNKEGILALIGKSEENSSNQIISSENQGILEDITRLNSKKTSHVNHKKHYAVVICIVLFALSNILIPVILGDIYPFTIAPMFRDTPMTYANYRIFAPNGKKLADNSRRELDPTGSPDPFKLRRYYDGNPVGCGVGICPPKTLGDFGIVHSEDQIKKHLIKNWPANLDLPYIEIEQEIIGPVDNQKVGILKVLRWRIDKPGSLTLDLR